jgi:hypothetical protein
MKKNGTITPVERIYKERTEKYATNEKRAYKRRDENHPEAGNSARTTKSENLCRVRIKTKNRHANGPFGTNGQANSYSTGATDRGLPPAFQENTIQSRTTSEGLSDARKLRDPSGRCRTHEQNYVEGRRENDTSVSKKTDFENQNLTPQIKPKSRVTIAEIWRELRYHESKQPIKINVTTQNTTFHPWKLLSTRRRVLVRRDGNDGWTARLIARPTECESIKRSVNSISCCDAYYGRRISPKYKQLICSIASIKANEKERQMMDLAAKGNWDDHCNSR